MFEKLKLQTRMFIAIGTVVIIIFTIVTAIITAKSERMAYESAVEKAEMLAEHHSIEMTYEFNKVLETLRTLAETFSQFENIPAAERRSVFNYMIKKNLEHRTEVIGIGTFWEPNALDGLDSKYIRATGHDSTGRFASYWHRANGSPEREPYYDYDKEGSNDWYIIPKKTLKDAFVNPYLYPTGGKMILETTISVPIIKDDRFLGIVSADIAVTTIQDWFENKLPAENGYFTVYSNDATIVYHPLKEHLGKKAKVVQAERDAKFNLSDNILNGVKFTFEDISTRNNVNNKFIFTPINIGTSTTPWALCVVVPLNTVNAQASEIRNTVIINAVIAIILLMLVIFYIARYINGIIQKLLQELSILINAATIGKLDIRGDVEKIDFEFRPIIAGFNATLDTIVVPLTEVSGYLERLAQGDIPDKIEGDYDGFFNTVKINLNQSIEAIHSLVTDVNKLAKNALEGKLDVRAETEHHNGKYKEVVTGINSTLDAIVLPLHEASMHLKNISVGDMPGAIENRYKGEFAIIIVNINTLIVTLNKIITEARQMADGDLVIDLIKRSERDEFIQSLSDMSKALISTIEQVRSAAEQIAYAAAEVSNSSQSLSQDAVTQASEAENVTNALHKINEQIKNNKENANQAKNNTVNALVTVRKANNAFKDTMSAMNEIVNKIDIIGEIAQKTEILAINVAMESARLGDIAKPYIVVADELKSVSERSRTAARQIEQLSKDSLMVSQKAYDLLQQLVPEIEKTSAMVQQIASAATGESESVDSIGKSLTNLNSLAQNSAASSEQLAASAEELSSQSDALIETMSFFKTGDNDPSHGNSNHIKTYSRKKKNLQHGVKIKLDEPANETF